MATYSDPVDLEEGERLCVRVGVKLVGDLVEVVDGAGLDPEHLRAQGDVLHDHGLVAAVGELHGLVQLVQQADVHAAEALVVGGCLVRGRDVHQVAGFGLVVQVLDRRDEACALIDLKLPFGARQDFVVHQTAVPWGRSRNHGAGWTEHPEEAGTTDADTDPDLGAEPIPCGDFNPAEPGSVQWLILPLPPRSWVFLTLTFLPVSRSVARTTATEVPIPAVSRSPRRLYCRWVNTGTSSLTSST